MTDERIMAAFRAFDIELEPDRAFSERLFATLAEGIEWGTMPGPSLRDRLSRALGLGPMPTGTRALRVAYLAAMLGVLLALAWGAVFIASQLRTSPTPAELVQLSQSVYEHPPAFSVTYKMPASGDLTLSSDGAGTWRVAQAGETQFTYWLWDGGNRVGSFDSSTLRWRAGTSAETGFWGLPGGFTREWTWANPSDASGLASATRQLIPCAGATSTPDGRTVLGHATDHVTCPDIDIQYWLDRESHLILRMVPGPTNPTWQVQPGGSELAIEATAFSLGPQPAALFDWAGPESAPTASGRILQGSDYRLSSLPFGSAMPAWSGPLMSGGRLESRSLIGRPTVLWLWTGASCNSCSDDNTDSLVPDAARVADRVHVVIVVASEPSEGWVATYFAKKGFTVPVVYDWDGAVRRLFDPKFGDVALVFDGAGRLVDERNWPPSVGELEAIADTYGSAGGSPAPSPSR